MSPLRQVPKGLATVVAVLMIGLMEPLPLPAGAAPLGDAAATTLRREPLQRPAELGNGALGGLQYANPTEGVDLVRPPAANNQGAAVMELPISIPPGRGGVQPNLTLTYDSSGENGWLGMGWDLNVGEITVDTRWGAPRYHSTLETETYLLDGAVLSPTAVTSNFATRVTERADFTRRVEDHYDLIIRHGDNPTNYWWEVRTKMGGIKWYGGKPDEGGPTGAASITVPGPDGQPQDKYVAGLGEGSVDEGAVLRDADGNIFRWAISAERDVGVNAMLYGYEPVAGERVGLNQQGYGKQLYLRWIRYTATSLVGGRDVDPADDAPYKVTFLRDGHLGIPSEQRRKDVIVDGTPGFALVTSDLLRRIDIHYGDPVYCPAAQPDCPLVRNYNQLSRRYNLNYTEGAFAKSLLASVDQLDANAVFATNAFKYYDDVRAADGGYNNFTHDSEKWLRNGDELEQVLLGEVPISALGAAESNSGDVHAYLGFNLLDPTKMPSVGAAITVAGGATESLAEFIDINGDQLPDKVFRDGIGGDIMFRLNQSGPGGNRVFGDAHEVDGLNRLSTEWNIGAAGSVEANLGVSVQFEVGFDVTVGEDYFEDVNQDGLVDLVSSGKVYFNRLVNQGGELIPTFDRDSRGTAVPMSTNAPDLSDIQALKDLQEQQEKDSPLADTVRRWIAPFRGTIAIGGAVTLDPPPDIRIEPPPYDGDGVRVAIQKGGTELWSAQLANEGQSVTPTNVNLIDVGLGEPVFFRVQSVYDGRRDQVKWEPVIQYVGHAPTLDVNGLDIYRYEAAKEFTLAGRSARAQMPLDGRVRIEGVVHKTKRTSDDVGVVVTLARFGPPTPIAGTPQIIPAAFVGDVTVSYELDVLGPRNGGVRETDFDRVALALATDSPIDVSAISWTNAAGNRGPDMFYVTASRNGQPVQTVVQGQRVYSFEPVIATDIYASSTLTAPPQIWRVPDDGDPFPGEPRHLVVDADIRVQDGLPPAFFPGVFVLTVKSREGLILCKDYGESTFSFPPTSTECELDAKEGDEMWFDVTTRNAALGNTRPPLDIHLVIVPNEVNDAPPGSGLVDIDPGLREVEPPSALHWPTPALITPRKVDVFPESFRGWGFAGYNGDGGRALTAMNPGAFAIDVPEEADFPDAEDEEDRPEDFRDPEFEDPVKGAPSYPFVPWYLDLRDAKNDVVGTVPSWRGFKDNMVGAARFVRSSRVSTDDPQVVKPSDIQGATDLGNGRVSAVRRLGLTAPSLGVVASALVVGAAFAMGPSFGLLDYADMNGDGFPDIIAPNSIRYTDPRGAYFDSRNPTLPTPASDMSYTVGVGFSGAAADVKGNSKGDAGASQDTSKSSGGGGSKTGDAATKGGTGSQNRYGYSIGGALDISASFTNPVAPDILDSEIDSDAAVIGFEHELADVNGDGLPDKVFAASGKVMVQLNLGYGFDSEIEWARDGFETSLSLGGSVGGDIGFQIFNRGISGGVSYNEEVDFPVFSWVDINGDGILDRLTKALDGDVEVAFGTGAGVLPNIPLDSLQEGTFELGGALPGDFDDDILAIPTGGQIAFNRTRGFGFGFDVTIPIGPLCVIGCWIIINPGAHFNRAISNSQVELTDINGDGYADSLKSNNDGEIAVSLNNHGRTNLLSQATNPVGGEIRLDYKRDGNTVAQPFSHWVLDRVEVNDGRSGDGVDTRVTTYEYQDNRYNPLEREILGYRTVTERQLNPVGNQLLRSIERQYRNGTVFESGLLERESLIGPNGTKLTETVSDWQFVDVYAGGLVNLPAEPTGEQGVTLLGMTVAPQRTKVTQRWYDGNNVGQETWSTYEYDSLGNVVRLTDVGEPELASDDVTAITTYSSCERSSSDLLKGAYACPAPVPAGRISPLSTPTRCPTWTAIPASLKVVDGAGTVLRDRDGAPALCDNSSMTYEEERLADGTLAITELDYDEWGSYNHIVYPANADGERVRLDYVYEENTHANVGTTIESRPANRAHDSPPDVTAGTGNGIPPEKRGIPYLMSVRTYDGRTGRVASREDANGNRTTYTYDLVGRLKTITGPYEQNTGRATVTFDYFPKDRNLPGVRNYAFATARHYDAFGPVDANGNRDPIMTAAFADGVGRVTQTKRDATVFRSPGGPPADVMVVSGAVDYDALGRPVRQWHPIEESLGSIDVFNDRDSGNGPPGPPTNPTETSYNLLDKVVDVKRPNNLHITTEYGFGDGGLGATLFTTTVIDQLGKKQRTYSDVRNNVRAVDNLPDGAPSIRAVYDYEPLGELSRVVDNGGSATTHEYDMFGRRVSTTTPDGGLVEWRYDVASNLVTKIDANMRANSVQTNYSYDGDRLVGIDYPPGTPDVSYVWGERGAGGNGAGRIVAITDGSREQTLAYDPLGAVVTDKSTMLVHNLNDPTGAKQTYTTSFAYEAFGRLRTVTYPDGEVLTNDYDRGGLIKSVAGDKAGIHYVYVDRLEYDQFLDRRFLKVGNGVTTLYEYDAPTRRLAHQLTNTPAREIQDYRFEYDKVGNLTSAVNDLPAPVSSLKGASSTQTYHYDPYYRLEAAEGTYALAPKGERTYELDLTYDVDGNIASKKQTDVVNGKLTQKPTTYDFTSLEYRDDKPHQLAKVGGKSYFQDPNGNVTGWKEGSNVRTVTWDATDRIRSIADQGSTSTYAYDASGKLGIERGPGGETAFVNDWYSARNASTPYKHIWAGAERIATKRSGSPDVEQMRYFFHKDFQGGTNMVTDRLALVFQHVAYFPGGEQWIVEQSDEFRTPHRFTGAYLDEVRQLINLGARWYEPREQFLYSPDPLLVDSPMKTVRNPALLPAYTYATSNPLTLVDPQGREVTEVRGQLEGAVIAGSVGVANAGVIGDVTQNPAPPNSPAPPDAPAKSDSSKKGGPLGTLSQETYDKVDRFSDLFETKALVEIDLVKTEKGYKLDEIRIAPLASKLGQFNIFKRPEPPSAVDVGGAGGKADPPSAKSGSPVKKKKTMKVKK